MQLHRTGNHVWSVQILWGSLTEVPEIEVLQIGRDTSGTDCGRGVREKAHIGHTVQPGYIAARAADSQLSLLLWCDRYGPHLTLQLSQQCIGAVLPDNLPPPQQDDLVGGALHVRDDVGGQ